GAVWANVLGPGERFRVTELTAELAMERYGTLAPDLRFSLEIRDVTALASKCQRRDIRELCFAGGAVRALRVPGGAAQLQADDRELLALQGSCQLHWLSFDAERA